MTEDWEKLVEERTVTREEALDRLEPRCLLYIGSGAGEPRFLVQGLAERLADLEPVELIQPYTLPTAAFCTLPWADRIRANAFIMSEVMRALVRQGRSDYTPTLPSRAPELMRSRKLPIDTAIVCVSPPDEHGFFSLGVSVDVTKTAVETARLVIAQVNPRMPRTFGASMVHAAEIDAFVNHKEALLEMPPVEADDVMQRILAHLRRIVPDGATIQVGAGRMTDLVLDELKEKRDLGLHTELITDGVMRLARLGVLNGRRKTLHPERMVAVAAAGSRSLYKFLHENPAVEFHSSDYVNSPGLIARNHRMVAVNFGDTIDMTGQVTTGVFGPDYLSGPPGRAEFMRGAAQAVGGKAILAIPSTAETPDGVVSRIVPHLTEGAEVLLTRSDVHYVVTEHGVAYLHGKSIRDRALALVSVADPAFRDDLMQAAKDRRLVLADQPVPRPVPTYPKELERWVKIKDGTEILLRPLKPEDSELMKDLFHSFSEQTRYLRFHQMVKEMPQRGRQAFFNVDYREELALAAALVDGDLEEFLGTGRFVVDEGTNSAEVAFVVRDDWQGRGLGGQIFQALAEIAEQRGIRTLWAEVLSENRPMLRVMDRAGFPMNTNRESGVVHVEIDLESGRRKRR